MGGVSDELSPCATLEGLILDCKLDFQVALGECAQMQARTDDAMSSQTAGAVALGPSGNPQGVRFFSPDAGQVVNREEENCELLPMPDNAAK